MTSNPRRRPDHFAAKGDRIITLVNTADEAVPLMDFLLANVRETSRNAVKGLLRHSQVKTGGMIVSQFDTPVLPGQEVLVNLARSFPQFSHPRLSIVYEDDDIIVVNKGYALLSVSTGGVRKEETAYSILRDYVKSENPANKIFIVHRLDRDTSGLMMFAKSEEAKEAMQHNWNNMVLDRRYVAVLDGRLKEDSGVITSNLDETSTHEMYSTKGRGEGKKAVTRYRVLARNKDYSLVEFSLDTGRKNQIRVHSRDLGHPIIGDHRYGHGAGPLHRLALHAYILRFVHPVTRRDMRFELPVPSRFAGIVKYNGNAPDSRKLKST